MYAPARGMLASNLQKWHMTKKILHDYKRGTSRKAERLVIHTSQNKMADLNELTEIGKLFVYKCVLQKAYVFPENIGPMISWKERKYVFKQCNSINATHSGEPASHGEQINLFYFKHRNCYVKIHRIECCRKGRKKKESHCLPY